MIKLLYFIASSHFMLLNASNDYSSVAKHPLLIDAVNSIECNSTTNTCVASKDVKVTKGPLTLYCDTLVAHLRKNAKGGNEIYLLHAQGHVKVYGAQGDLAMAQEATYDIDKRSIVLISKQFNTQSLAIHQNNIVQAPELEILLDDQYRLKETFSRGRTSVAQPRGNTNDPNDNRAQALVSLQSFKQSTQGSHDKKAKSRP